MTPRSTYLALPDGFVAGVLDVQWTEIVFRDLEMYKESTCFEF